jgi:hypothetical protein
VFPNWKSCGTANGGWALSQPFEFQTTLGINALLS